MSELNQIRLALLMGFLLGVGVLVGYHANPISIVFWTLYTLLQYKLSTDSLKGKS